MTARSIAQRRLHSQLLAAGGDSPHEVVAHLGAVQAQDYLGALWAVGARTRKPVLEGDVERALAERTIVRCWPMRGTLHFVAAEDARWMLDLLAPRVLARHRARLERDFELDPATLRRCRKLVERALRGGKARTRPELYALFEDAGIATAASRGLHILFTLAHERVVCFGARRGKQPTFVLFDEWLPSAPSKTREEALEEVARRYFNGHGPATVADFVWWSGLTVKEANEAIALSSLTEEVIDGQTLWSGRASAGKPKERVHLLPPFDEYTVAYKDRSAVLDAAFARNVNAGGGMINAIVVVDGIVAGNWKRTLKGRSVEIAVAPFRELSARETKAIEQEAERFSRFLGCESTVVRF
ncbi:MAG TPA: winged helix DNA-binding domain-containing protein [Thermoanaerobaculia bacterium]|jgi:hypothetical protein